MVCDYIVLGNSSLRGPAILNLKYYCISYLFIYSFLLRLVYYRIYRPIKANLYIFPVLILLISTTHSGKFPHWGTPTPEERPSDLLLSSPAFLLLSVCDSYAVVLNWSSSLVLKIRRMAAVAPGLVLRILLISLRKSANSLFSDNPPYRTS